MSEQINKSYFAIIPANVRYDNEITPNAKLLYGEITALTNDRGYCWATNKYFSDLYNVSTVSVSKWINSLVKKGYITSDFLYKEGTKEIDKRCLRIVSDPIKEKFNTPIKDKFKDNSTYINNTNNNNIYKEESEQSSDDPILFNLDVTNQPQEVKLTKALFDLFRKNQKEKGVTVFTRYDKSKLSTWLPHIEKMINIDGVTYEDFKILYTWLGSNYREAEFWKKNILSTQKLREQYPKLQQAINSDAVLANKLKQEQANKFKNKTMSL